MPFERRFAVLLLSMTFVAAALAGCGRRGPLELPPEAIAHAQQAELQDPSASGAAADPRSGPQGESPRPPAPGTIGNRPPAQYPFVLDPLL